MDHSERQSKEYDVQEMMEHISTIEKKSKSESKKNEILKVKNNFLEFKKHFRESIKFRKII